MLVGPSWTVVPHCFSRSATSRMPTAIPSWLFFSVTSPTTSHCRLNSAPPELPGLTKNDSKRTRRELALITRSPLTGGSQQTPIGAPHRHDHGPDLERPGITLPVEGELDVARPARGTLITARSSSRSS